MASRMERYYKTRDSKRRSVRNESLYQTIYDDETYSNIEGVVATPKANEINIEKIQELLASRENERNRNRRLVKKPVEIEVEEPFDSDDDKSYDIRDILVKAKDARQNPEDSYRNLKNTEYNILKNIKINNNQNFAQEEELKELINTITNTSMLNKLSDRDLSLNMLDDLKSNTMVGDSSSIQALLEQTKEANLRKTAEMDKTFLTSSLGFKDEDFENLKDLGNSIHENNKAIRMVLMGLFVVVAIILVLVIYNIMK